MKPSFRHLLTFAAVLGLSLSARAESFGLAAQVVSDSNVLNLGSTALAYDIGKAVATVNGIAFSGVLAQGATFAISLNGAFTDASGVNQITGISSGFASILQHDNGTFQKPGSTTPIQLVFSNLAANESYELQLFSGLASGPIGFTHMVAGNASADIGYGPGTNSSSSGDYSIILSFQTGAVPSNEVINITSGAASTYGLINAVNLRDMGVAAVPEPSTWLMFGLGAIGFAVFLRRRKLAAVRA